MRAVSRTKTAEVVRRGRLVGDRSQRKQLHGKGRSSASVRDCSVCMLVISSVSSVLPCCCSTQIIDITTTIAPSSIVAALLPLTAATTIALHS